MGVYKYVRALWKKPEQNLGELWQQRLILWRREPTTIRIDHPTRIDRARSLGYKAKQGIFVVRQRVLRGGHTRPTWRGGRRSKRSGTKMALQKNYQAIAEQKVQRHYPNCEVLNSYFVGQDGLYYWYETIVVDRSHPSILANKDLRGIAMQRGRAFRGLTSAGRRGRGLRRKGKGAEKVRGYGARRWRCTV